MHRPLTQKLQFNGERDLGYTFAVAEWNVFGNTKKECSRVQPSGKAEKAFRRTNDGWFPLCNHKFAGIRGEGTKVYSLDF